jgi:hypothetical protein
MQQLSYTADILAGHLSVHTVVDYDFAVEEQTAEYNSFDGLVPGHHVAA